MIPIFSVVGRSNTGKTNFIRRLIGELKKRGYRTAVIKHDPEDHGEVDKKGSDTDIFFSEGSDAVALSSPTRLTVFRKVEQDMLPEDVISLAGSVDCVILEGYKELDYPKIEVRRNEGDVLPLNQEQLLAVVYSKGAAEKEDHQAEKKAQVNKTADIPEYYFDQISEIMQLLEKTILSNRSVERGDD